MSLTAAFFTALMVVTSPRPAHAAVPDPVLICPAPIREGESDRVGMPWPGANLIGPVVFHTVIGGHTADLTDFTGAERRIVNNQGDSDTAWVQVLTTQDSRD